MNFLNQFNACLSVIGFTDTGNLLFHRLEFFDGSLTDERFIIYDNISIHILILLIFQNRKSDLHIGPFTLPAGDSKAIAFAIIKFDSTVNVF